MVFVVYWEKGWLFSIGNGDDIRPLEKGRKCPVICSFLVSNSSPSLLSDFNSSFSTSAFSSRPFSRSTSPLIKSNFAFQ